ALAVLGDAAPWDTNDGQMALWSALKHDPALAADEVGFKAARHRLDEFRQAHGGDEAEKLFRFARSETEVLIEDLIVNNAELVDGRVCMAGSMKIVRIFNEAHATQFYVAVVLASDLAKFRHTYCVLRDYSRF